MKLLESLIKEAIPAKLFFIKNLCISCKLCLPCKYYNINHHNQNVHPCDVQQAIREFFPGTVTICPTGWDLSDFDPKTIPIDTESLDFLKRVPPTKLGNIQYTQGAKQ